MKYSIKSRALAATSVLISLTSLPGVTHGAETLGAYVANCITKLDLANEGLHGFMCTDGISIPSSDGIMLGATTNNWLGRVPYDNPSIDAVFLCRSVNNVAEVYGAAGYIIQNRENGNTCFFDGKFNGSTNNTAQLTTSSVGGNNWQKPEDLELCVNCHTADPFIVSRGLADGFQQLDLLYNGRNLLEDYNVVGSDDNTSHFFGWDEVREANIDPNPGSCGICHRIGTDDKSNELKEDLEDNLMMAPSIGSLFYVDDKFVVNETFRIQNYWDGNSFINIDENDDLQANNSNVTTLNARWTFERVGNYYRIKNASKPGEYLHNQESITVIEDNVPAVKDVLVSDEIQSGWWSSQWKLIEFNGGEYYQIRNRWKPTHYLHVQNGSIESGEIHSSWWSARWRIVQMN